MTFSADAYLGPGPHSQVAGSRYKSQLELIAWGGPSPRERPSKRETREGVTRFSATNY